MKVASGILSNLGLGNIGLIILIVSIFIDISPIKINPIKWIFGYLGKWFNNSIQKALLIVSVFVLLNMILSFVTN